MFCLSHVILLKFHNALPEEWLDMIFQIFLSFFHVLFSKLFGKIEKSLKSVSENIVLELSNDSRIDTHAFRLRVDVYFYLQLRGGREMCTQHRFVFHTKLLWLAGCLNYQLTCRSWMLERSVLVLVWFFFN